MTALHASSSQALVWCRRLGWGVIVSGTVSAAAAAPRALSRSSIRWNWRAVWRRRCAASPSTICRRSTATICATSSYRADPKRYSRAALLARHCGARGVERRRPADRRGRRRRHHRQRRRRHRRRRAAVSRFLRRTRPEGHALRDSRLDRRDDVERDLHLAAPRGISHVLSCGCTSSTDALGYAAR